MLPVARAYPSSSLANADPMCVPDLWRLSAAVSSAHSRNPHSTLGRETTGQDALRRSRQGGQRGWHGPPSDFRHGLLGARSVNSGRDGRQTRRLAGEQRRKPGKLRPLIHPTLWSAAMKGIGCLPYRLPCPAPSRRRSSAREWMPIRLRGRFTVGDARHCDQVACTFAKGDMRELEGVPALPRVYALRGDHAIIGR